MSWEAFGWILVVLSLIGNIFVIKQKIQGLWLWVISNIGLIIYNIHLGILPQIFLFTIYLILAIWGLFVWNKKAK